MNGSAVTPATVEMIEAGGFSDDKIKRWQLEVDREERRVREQEEKDARNREEKAIADRAIDEAAKENSTGILSTHDIAISVLQYCNPLGYIRNTFSKIHSGDQESIDSISLAIACQSVINSQGIQPNFGGERGSGKTSSVRAALHLVNRSHILEGSVSDKALFHFLNKPEMIVFSDDVELSPDIVATIKRAMSNYQSRTTHRTLDKNRERSEVTIEPRQLFLFTSVSDKGDDQLRDRQFVVSYLKNDKSNKRFLEFIQTRAVTGQEELPVLPEVLVCREMFDEIKSKTFRVAIPFAKEITFNDPDQRRNVIMVFDFIKAFAVLRFMQREQSHTDDDTENVITLKAEPLDAVEAIKAYNAMGPQVQALKLSKDELGLWGFIVKEGGGEITFPDLVERYAIGAGSKSATETKIRRLLEGRDGKGGLVEKVVGMTITPESREVGTGKWRNVKVIRCHKGPGLTECVDFVTYTPPPINPTLVPCPFPVPNLSISGTGKNEPQSQKEEHNDNEFNNIISPVQKKVSNDRSGCCDIKPDSSLCFSGLGQGTGKINITTQLCPELRKSPTRSRPSDGKDRTTNGQADRDETDYEGMSLEQLVEIQIDAGNRLDNIPHPERFKRALSSVRKGSKGASQS